MKTMNKDPRKNAEGYADPTAYYGTREIIREESEADKRVNELIKVLKFIIRQSGCELITRIQIRDVKSGREYK